MHALFSDYVFGYNFFEPLHEYSLVGPQGGASDGGVKLRLMI